MMKRTALALMLLAPALGHARSEPLDGRPVPLFPELTWGLSKEAALSKGLKAYAKRDAKVEVIGLPSVTLGDIDFAAQAEFGKKDVSDVPSGLNYIVLRHEGRVAKSKYERFIRSVTSGFLYAGKSSGLDNAASFYNSIKQNGYLVVMTSNREPNALSVAIAPGRSK